MTDLTGILASFAFLVGIWAMARLERRIAQVERDLQTMQRELKTLLEKAKTESGDRTNSTP
jgi:Skp family chaperone for outer membrane proteins